VSRAARTIGIVNPVPGIRGGNRVTALRWAAVLRRLQCKVFVEESWSGRECDVLVALHARRSRSSVLRFKGEHPARPLIVAATGTDIFGDAADGGAALASFELADRIIVLQPRAIDQLPESARARARVVYQSVRVPQGEAAKAHDAFEVCAVANLRPVKDPLLPAVAARLLPPTSRVRVVHVGSLADESLRAELDLEVRENARFRWLGGRSRRETLAVLARARLFVSSSRHEGGANAISEALALGVPILATHIPGNLGLLGGAYPGTYPVGDARALADLMGRAETDPPFYRELDRACRDRAWITDPALEVATWRAILGELAGDGAPT
jgi:putative glycosyltransferase (TIGR04348 family)